MKKRIMPLELLFSFIIIISIIFIITVICLEIKAYSAKINGKTEMALIASNIMENIKTRSYDDVEKYLDELSYVGMTKKIENNVQYITIYGDEFSEKFFGTAIPKDFIIEFESENNAEGFNVQKKISIFIYYNSNKADGFEISTIIERENINECNTPIISDEYFKEYSFSEKEYEFIPIKYSKDKECFITTTKDDTEWFNYSAKQWAKILIFDKNDENLKSSFINEDGTIEESIIFKAETLDVKNYMYIWIPNFSIKDDITYFRYKAGKKAIKNELSYSGGKYLYLNKIGEEIKDISEECNFEGIYGVWRKFGDEQDAYYSNFNKTKYAPQRLEK